MLTYSFKESDIPMYEYLYQCIKNDIIHQKLKPMKNYHLNVLLRKIKMSV